MSSSNPSILETLSPALIQTFGTVLLGYAFGRFKLIPAEGMRAMGMFVTMLALPSLLLRNIANIDLNNIEWNFFIAMFIGKASIFLVAVLVSLLKHGFTKRGWSDAGCFGMTVTQSNDFAMGLPILTALFAAANPSYPGLIYVMSPISICIINPICFLMMEYGRESPKVIAARLEAAAAAAAAVEAAKQEIQLSHHQPQSTGENGTNEGPPALPASTSSSSFSNSNVSGFAPPRLPGATSNALDIPGSTMHHRSNVNSPTFAGTPSSYVRIPPLGLTRPSVDQILDNTSDSDEDSDDDSDHSPSDETNDTAITTNLLQNGEGITIDPTVVEDKEDEPSTLRMVATVGLKVVKSPVVISSILGILVNLATNHSMPVYVDSFFAALGETFSALALFILGVNMNGKLALFQDRRKLFLPLLLIAAKSLALPIIARLVIGALGENQVNLPMCTFLVGTFPMAPSSHFFAIEFGAQSAELVAPTMVLSTFVAAPIMFISSQLVTVDLSNSAYNAIVSDTTRISAGFGFLGATYCIICFVYNRRYRLTRERLLLTLCASQAIFGLSIQFCEVNMDNSPVADAIRWWFVVGSVYGIYGYLALIAVNEVVRRRHGTKAEAVCYKWYNVIGFVFTFAPLFGLQFFAHRAEADTKFDSCSKKFGNAQWWTTMTMVAICIIKIVFGLLQLRGDSESDLTAHPDTQPHIELDHSLNTKESGNLRESLIAGNNANSDQHEMALPPSTNIDSNPPSRTQSPDIRRQLVQGDQQPNGAGYVPSSRANHPNRLPREPPLSAAEIENFWLFACKVQLFFGAASLFIWGSLQVWSYQSGGARVEIVLFDAVSFSSMGVYTLALFGFTKNIISPLRPVKKWIKKKLQSRDADQMGVMDMVPTAALAGPAKLEAYYAAAAASGGSSHILTAAGSSYPKSHRAARSHLASAAHSYQPPSFLTTHAAKQAVSQDHDADILHAKYLASGSPSTAPPPTNL